MINDYKELRKQYNIPAIFMLLILALPFLYAVQVTQSKKIALICFLIYLPFELVLVIIKDTLLIKKLNSLIYKDINLDLMASYILNQKRKSIKTIKTRVQVATIFYFYKIGDFGSIEAVVDELKKIQKFTDVEQVKLNEILLNANLFSRPDLKEDEFEELLSDYLADYELLKMAYRARYDLLVKKEPNDAVLKEVTNNKFSQLESMYLKAVEFEELLSDYLADYELLKMAYRARYDLLVKKEPNDAVLKEVTNNKFSQLESMYLKAVNEYLKGNRNKAMELFRTIAKEDERLYLVRMAQAYLDSENSGEKSVSLGERQEEVTLKLLRMKLIEVKPAKSAKSTKWLAFFKGWKIALLLIPPFLLYAMVLVVIGVVKELVKFVQSKFEDK